MGGSPGDEVGATSEEGGKEMTDRNDLPRGVYCQHGKRIMVPENEEEQYSDFVFANPYPCDQKECSQDQVAKHMEDEAAEYEAAQLDEYWRMTNS